MRAKQLIDICGAALVAFVLGLGTASIHAQSPLWSPHAAGPQATANETWALGGLPCLDNALTSNLTCKNIWHVAAGTTISFVTASAAGCGTPNWTQAHAQNVLKLTATAIAPAITLTGSIPEIPIGSTINLSFGLCIASGNSSWPALHTLVGLKNLSTEFLTGAIAGSYSSPTFSIFGTNQGEGSSTPNATLSQNAWHQVLLHVDPTAANCSISLDGTLVGTFTCTVTNNADTITINGPSSAGPMYVGNVTLDSPSYQGYAPPTMFCDGTGQGSAGAATVANLNAGCAPSPSSGLWTINTAGVSWSTTPGASSMAYPQTAAGKQHLGNTGVWLSYDLSNSTGGGPLIKFAPTQITSGTNTFAYDFIIPSLACSDTNFYAFPGFTGATDFLYLLENGVAGNCQFNLYAYVTAGGACSSGTAFLVNLNNVQTTTYRVVASWTTGIGGAETMTIWSKANPPVELGTATCTATTTGATTGFLFGHTGSNFAGSSSLFNATNLDLNYYDGRATAAQ